MTGKLRQGQCLQIPEVLLIHGEQVIKLQEILRPHLTRPQVAQVITALQCSRTGS